MLSVLIVASLIAIPSFVIVTTSQTASADSPAENFTIIALPDTQYYSQGYPAVFENQTRWIVQNKDALNIVFVTHLGDIVNVWNVNYQWQNADRAMSILDGKVPYALLPGNHDEDHGYSPPYGASATYYENYFPNTRYTGYSYWGGSYDHDAVASLTPNMNNYQLFTWSGMDFITISLQYNPTDDVLAWADNVLSTYSNRRAIVSTHAYLNVDGSFASGGGAQIWQHVVVPENNVFLVLCGHEYSGSTPGVWEKVDNLDNNTRTVYQLLSDYQCLSNGGDGWLRIMTFVPSENQIYVKTYSPYLDQYWTDNANQFEMYYPMNPTVMTAGGGISQLIYIGVAVVIVMIIAAILIIKPFLILKPFQTAFVR